MKRPELVADAYSLFIKLNNNPRIEKSNSLKLMRKSILNQYLAGVENLRTSMFNEMGGGISFSIIAPKLFKNSENIFANLVNQQTSLFLQDLFSCDQDTSIDRGYFSYIEAENFKLGTFEVPNSENLANYLYVFAGSTPSNHKFPDKLSIKLHAVLTEYCELAKQGNLSMGRVLSSEIDSRKISVNLFDASFKDLMHH